MATTVDQARKQIAGLNATIKQIQNSISENDCYMDCTENGIDEREKDQETMSYLRKTINKQEYEINRLTIALNGKYLIIYF